MINDHVGFRGDASRLRPPSNGFQCGETLERNEFDDDATVTFYCTLPPSNQQQQHRLEFRCRESSCGVLLENEPAAAVKVDDSVMVDPNFFDEGYTLAGKTGFQVWAGSRLLVEVLIWPHPFDCLGITKWQQLIVKNNTRVLELGAGVGVVGSSLAAAGAQVLLTDLSTLVEHSIRPNLERNGKTRDAACPEWLKDTHAVQIGNGWVGAKPLDWTVPLEKQLSNKVVSKIDLIVASDCVWLVSMLDALLSTVASVFEASPSAKLLLSFQRRDPADGDDQNAMFTSVDRVLNDIQARQWTVECLAWRPLEQANDLPPKEVFVFQVSPK